MIEALGREHDSGPSGMTLHEEPGRSLVEVWGEVDLAVRQNAGPLCQAVSERAMPVVIDAGRVSFVDSAGMSILVRIARDAESGGYPVELRNAPWMLRELMTITGIDRLLPIADGAPSGTPDRTGSPAPTDPPGPPPSVPGETSPPGEARDAT